MNPFSNKKKEKAQFGKKLKAAVIPRVVADCVEFLENPNKTYLQTEGLFRQSGNQSIVQDLKNKYDRGESVDLVASVGCDPHTVATLLKLWFRELPESLLTFDMYDMFIAAIAVQEEAQKTNKIRQVLQFIPKPNLVLLKYMIDFLYRVSSFHEVNMMSPANLAIVFGPNILRPIGFDVNVMIEDSGYANEAVTFMINHYDSLFDGLDAEPEESQPQVSGGDDESEPSSSSDSDESGTSKAKKLLGKASKVASNAKKAAVNKAHSAEKAGKAAALKLSSLSLPYHHQPSIGGPVNVEKHAVTVEGSGLSTKGSTSASSTAQPSVNSPTPTQTVLPEQRTKPTPPVPAHAPPVKPTPLPPRASAPASVSTEEASPKPNKPLPKPLKPVTGLSPSTDDDNPFKIDKSEKPEKQDKARDMDNPFKMEKQEPKGRAFRPMPTTPLSISSDNVASSRNAEKSRPKPSLSFTSTSSTDASKPPVNKALPKPPMPTTANGAEDMSPKAKPRAPPPTPPTRKNTS